MCPASAATYWVALSEAVSWTIPTTASSADRQSLVGARLTARPSPTEVLFG